MSVARTYDRRQTDEQSNRTVTYEIGVNNPRASDQPNNNEFDEHSDQVYRQCTGMLLQHTLISDGGTYEVKFHSALGSSCCGC